jgi:hypothetical protein
MNIHTKIAKAVFYYVAILAAVVSLAVLNNHPTNVAVQQPVKSSAGISQPVDPAGTDTSTAADAGIIKASQTCADQGYLGCSDDVRDYWAKDAYNAYAAPIGGTSRADILKGFVASYEGSYTGPVNWGPTYLNVRSLTSPDVYHVFHVIQPRNA